MSDIKHPQDHHDPHGPHSPRHFIKNLTEKVDFGEDIDFVVGVTATALGADQLLKQASCKDHKVMHLAKAGLSAAVGATAFAMMAREHNQRKHPERLQHRHPHNERGRDYDSDDDHNRRLRSRSRSTKRRMIAGGDNRPYREEDWAVVRPRSPDRYAPPRRRASVYEGAYYNRNEDRNPDYYRASEGLPYPDDDAPAPRQRSISPEARSRSRGRRVRSYSPPKHRDPERSPSKGGFQKFLEVVRGGLERYDRYDHGRR